MNPIEFALRAMVGPLDQRRQASWPPPPLFRLIIKSYLMSGKGQVVTIAEAVNRECDSPPYMHENTLICLLLDLPLL